MSRKTRNRRHDNRDMILMALADSPQTTADIKEHFYALPRRFGVFSPLYRLSAAEDASFEQELAHDLERMAAQGWLFREENRYALTAVGRQEADRRLAGVRRAVALAAGWMQPEAVSRVAVAVHLILAAVKLPAAVLSGSMGLLNDSVDTLLDGLSSLLVFFGVKYQRERAVNFLLVAMMLLTGGLALYASLRRVFVPAPPEVDLFAFLSAMLSGLVCLGLGLYQRYAGVRNGSMTLIMQSVDSRNHVLVAAGVTAGLIAALLDFPLLDTAVGIAVAALILRSGIELAAELLQAGRDGGADLSRYPMFFAEQYRGFRRTQLQDWLLHLVETRQAVTLEALRNKASQDMTFDSFPILREIGLPQRSQTEESIVHSIGELFEKGWIKEIDGKLWLTHSGTYRLHWQIGRMRRITSRALVDSKPH
ncbi:MAG: cation transporter [Anaerolineales bacterium]|nr:cation transporter [Anaerolineales bacterium]